MGNGFVEAMRAPDATSWWILLPSPSAPPSAAPIPGSMWNSLARASWNGFKPSWNCPGGSLPMTPSAMSLPVWTQPNSRTAWCPGPRPSRNCCPVRWSPLTARRPDGPTTGRGARGPCIWSAAGRVVSRQVKCKSASSLLMLIRPLRPAYWAPAVTPLPAALGMVR